MGIRNEISRRYTLRDWYVSHKVRKLIGRLSADLVISEVINKGDPALVGRLGGTEGRFIGEYLKMRRYLKFGIPIPAVARFNYRWRKRCREVQFNAGFIFHDWNEIENFVNLYQECLENTDALGAWGTAFGWAESLAFTSKNFPEVIPIGHTAPWIAPANPDVAQIPWSAALEGKKVLVIAGFAESIKNQHLKSKVLFDNCHYPDFSLSTIQAPLSAGGSPNPESDWFSDLTTMEKTMEKIDFDIALVSAGAYSYPLALKAKKMGKIGIHCGGGLQLFFGIMGGRWETNPSVCSYSNEHWVRPSLAETPVNSNQVEDGCYW